MLTRKLSAYGLTEIIMQCLKSDDSYCAWPIRDAVCRQTFQPHISVSDVMDEAINSGLPTSGVLLTLRLL